MDQDVRRPRGSNRRESCAHRIAPLCTSDGHAGDVAFAQSRESEREMDFSDQERIFGSLLGSVPTRRAKTNGLVVYKGYIVAEFGDTTWVDPTYSVAKSMMASVAGIGVRDGKINVDDPVNKLVKDGGYDSPRNSQVTWKMHLQQETEWEGNMWGKNDDFVGHEQFGEGERKPRERQRPGTYYEYNDVRINRPGLSLLKYKVLLSELSDGELSQNSVFICDPRLIGSLHPWGV